MGKRIHHLREVSEEEVAQLRTLSSSRTQPYRTVQRAKLIVSMIRHYINLIVGFLSVCFLLSYKHILPKTETE